MSTRFDPRSLPGGRPLPTDVEFDPAAAEPADTPIAGRAMVVVVTDRLSEREDSIGPLVTELLEEEGFLVGGVVGVPADEAEVRKARRNGRIKRTGRGNDANPHRTIARMCRIVPGLRFQGPFSANSSVAQQSHG